MVVVEIFIFLFTENSETFCFTVFYFVIIPAVVDIPETKNIVLA